MGHARKTRERVFKETNNRSCRSQSRADTVEHTEENLRCSSADISRPLFAPCLSRKSIWRGENHYPRGISCTAICGKTAVHPPPPLAVHVPTTILPSYVRYFLSTFVYDYFTSALTLRRYRDYIETSVELYNKVDVDDFEYMEKLGEGAFGKVVRGSHTLPALESRLRSCAVPTC